MRYLGTAENVLSIKRINYSTTNCPLGRARADDVLTYFQENGNAITIPIFTENDSGSLKLAA